MACYYRLSRTTDKISSLNFKDSALWSNGVSVGDNLQVAWCEEGDRKEGSGVGLCKWLVTVVEQQPSVPRPAAIKGRAVWRNPDVIQRSCAFRRTVRPSRVELQPCAAESGPKWQQADPAIRYFGGSVKKDGSVLDWRGTSWFSSMDAF